MKKKPIIITVAIVLLLVVIVFVVNNKEKSPLVKTPLEVGSGDEEVSKDGEDLEAEESNAALPNSPKADGVKSDKAKVDEKVDAKADSKNEKKDGNDSKSTSDTKQDNNKNKLEVSDEGKNNKVSGSQIILNSLSNTAYEVQDNTITDSWGVVFVHDELPKELQGAESYQITIGDEVYDLKRNKYNAEVFGGQVSSIKHTKKEVDNGIITKK